MLVSFFKRIVLKIDNFTDAGAKNCCSALRSCWMSLLAGLFVCLRLCVLAGDIKISASTHSQLDRAAPAWSLVCVSPRAQRAPAYSHPLNLEFPQIKALSLRLQRRMRVQGRGYLYTQADQVNDTQKRNIQPDGVQSKQAEGR